MGLQIRLLGPLAVSKDGQLLDLPASRKVRALLAYLALTARAVPRQHLCALFWETATDPRGELRWHLSKLRACIGASRLSQRDDCVRLDLADSFVDAREVQRELQKGIDTLAPQSVQCLHALFAGELLEGLEVDRCPEFMGWLLGQRRRFRVWRVALLERLVEISADGDALTLIEQWLEIAPFDVRAHEHLFDELARRGRIRERDEQLAVSTRLFRAEGFDCTGLRKAWRASSARRTGALSSKPTTHATEQAYECYLLGRQHLSRMMRRGLDESRKMFDRSIALDPGYAPAWAGLATVHACLYEWFEGGTVSLALAEQASRRALEAAPRLAEAHAARGLVRAQSKSYDESVDEFEEAIRLNPYLFDGYYYLARTAFSHGDMQLASDMYRQASQARPQDFQSAMLLATPLQILGRDDAARDALRDGIRRAELILDLNPNDGRALSLGAGSLVEDGQVERGLEWARRALELHPDDSSALVNVACANAQAGEISRALDMVEQVFARGLGKRDWVLCDPHYDALRGEPRFQQLLGRLK